MVNISRYSSKHQYGLTYLALIFAVAILSLVAASTCQLWSTLQKRDKERELLIVGDQFRQAIGRYYEASPGGAKKYPYSFDDLLKDNRRLVPLRHLRKLYPDPVTGKAEWGIIQAPTGGIMGVFSLSEEKPLKGANFELQDKEFEAKEKFSEWRFVYLPPLSGTALQIGKGQKENSAVDNQKIYNPASTSTLFTSHRESQPTF